MVMTPKQKRVLDYIEGYYEKENLMPSRREIADGLGLSSVATVQEHIEALEKNGHLFRGVEGGARDFALASTKKVAKGFGGGNQGSGNGSQNNSSNNGDLYGDEFSENEIPLLGRVAAGFPIEVFAQQKRVEIPASLLGISLRSRGGGGSSTFTRGSSSSGNSSAGTSSLSAGTLNTDLSMRAMSGTKTRDKNKRVEETQPAGHSASHSLLAPYFALEVQGDSMRDDGILDGDLVVVEKKSIARSGDTVVALLNGEATLKRYVQPRGKSEIELHPANPQYPIMRIQDEDRFEIQGILRGVIRTYGKGNSKGHTR